MHSSLKNLVLVKNKVNEIIKQKQLKTDPKIVVVTKTFALNKITPLLESGHIHFGENKIQEAENKWLDVRNNYHNLKLHMIGKLQSNKAKKAVKIFDYIHSVDSIKLAKKIADEQVKQNKKIKLFLQVNIGEESQKNGVPINDIDDLVSECKNMNLNVIGLMCLPPLIGNISEFFSTIKKKMMN